MQTLSDTLRAFRLSMQLTQAELAARMDCGASVVSAYENARRKHYMPYLLRLSTLLRRPLEQLLPQLLQHCPASERLLLRGELDYQRQLEDVQARKARQRSERHGLELRKCQRQLTEVQLHARALLQVCGGVLPPPYVYIPGCPQPIDELRLCWDRCDVQRRLLLQKQTALKDQLARAQCKQKTHNQRALRWQQACKAVGKMAA